VKDRKGIIDYLVRKNHGSELEIVNYRVPDTPLGDDFRKSDPPTEEESEARIKIFKYRVQLGAMPENEFDELRKQVFKEIQENKEWEESDLDFNRLYSMADFGHWLMASYWTLEEGTTLILSRDPRKVSWARVEQYVLISDFAKKYEDTRELVNRAAEVGILARKVSPRRFVSWAAECGLDIPEPLQDLIDHTSTESRDRETADVVTSDVQPTEQKKYEYNEPLQQAANHIAGELREERGRRPTLDDVVKVMIKILDGKHPAEKDIINLIKVNSPIRKPNNDDAFHNSILRRIRAEW
jgi:hypothetical protein